MPANREYKIGDNFLTGFGILTLKGITHKSDGVSFYSLYDDNGSHVCNASKEALDDTQLLPPFNPMPAEKEVTPKRMVVSICHKAEAIEKHCSEIETILNAMQDCLASDDDELQDAVDNALLANNVLCQRVSKVKRITKDI